LEIKVSSSTVLSLVNFDAASLVDVDNEDNYGDVLIRSEDWGTCDAYGVGAIVLKRKMVKIFENKWK
jgi:hypothetical protein